MVARETREEGREARKSDEHHIKMKTASSVCGPRIPLAHRDVM